MTDREEEITRRFLAGDLLQQIAYVREKGRNDWASVESALRAALRERDEEIRRLRSEVLASKDAEIRRLEEEIFDLMKGKPS